MDFIDFFCIFLYMIASVFFIMGIKKLGKADTARKGNLMSSIGMGIAVLSVLISQDVFDGGLVAYIIIILAIAAGSVIGFIWAKKVEMTGMPQLVALF
ncbi:MAG: NAD(P)(+) transhydrogenase (Re/Si-specific) subunit beta, partial [Clostridiales bacterium]|nr:NAD(P)(+) transhydrogenase (Re/Si-specific) subunit beta [Clostridiales bacterium]